MATLNESSSGKAVKGRTRRTAPRVDLTAMVDLMFLLTTFFMLTTSLGTLNAADVAKPDQCDDCTMDYPASRTMTVLLAKDEQVISYLGTPENADMKVIALKDIQSEIASNKRRVAEANNNNTAKYMIVILKPTKTARFKDFVDAVDEMKIGDIKSYTIDDKNISAIETDFMKSKGL